MIASSVYAFLLRAFPARFRSRYGASMRECFEVRYARAAKDGARSRFLTAAFADLLWSAALERSEAAREWLFFPNFHEQFARREHERRPMCWQSFVLDLRYAIRMFLRTPVFTSLTVIALALGIGANSAIFSVVNGVLLRALPYSQPDRLVMVWSDNTREGLNQYPLSPADFLDIKAGVRKLDRMEGMYSFLMGLTMRLDAGMEQVTASGMTPGMFDLLGRHAALGRTLGPADKSGVIVLSDGFWRRRFGADPNIIGKQVTISEHPTTIVGVMPPDFHFPLKSMLGPSGFSAAVEPESWVPIDITSAAFQQNGQPARIPHYLSVVARLAPGESADAAHDELNALAAGLEREYPLINKGLKSNLVPLHTQAVGRVRPALVLLLAGVGLVLLMACVNVANLLLARSAARQKEIAVRSALGAGRARLLAQMLVESSLLGVAGGVCGLLLGWAGVRLLVGIAPPELPRLNEVRLDGAVVLFTAFISLLVGTLVGLLPALAASRGNAQPALKDSSRGVTGGALRKKMRATLVVAEISLAVLLTVGAGLLVRSFVRLLEVDPGFRAENLLTLQIQLPNRYNTADARREFYETLFARIDAMPGVVTSGGTTRLPLGSTNVSTRVMVEGRAMDPASMPEVEMRRAVKDYFRAMGMPLLHGRTFTAEDAPTGPSVVVVNDAMARRLWPGEDAVGKHFKMGADPATPWSTVIGVVGDLHHSGLEAPPSPEFYSWYAQGPPSAPFVVVRTQGDPASLGETLRGELRSLEKDLAVYDIRTMNAVRSASVAERRFILVLVASFGGLALLLAAVGVYGVMALVVGERTQEMGIRLALGAEPIQVLGLVVRQGMALAAFGVGGGVIASLALMPTMRTLLYEISPFDPSTLLVVPLLLLLVALGACLAPGRRAMRLDAVTALRYE